MVRIACLFGVIGVFASTVSVVTAEPVTFERDIAPLLKRHCVKCHGATTQKSQLKLDTAAAARSGGKRGPALPDLLVQVISGTHAEIPQMPYKRGPLDSAQIALIKQWVAEGAHAPAEEPPSDDRHWAFIAPVKAPLPHGETTHPIDAFIRASLAKAGLEPSPPAAPATLIRRLHLDLTGEAGIGVFDDVVQCLCQNQLRGAKAIFAEAAHQGASHQVAQPFPHVQHRRGNDDAGAVGRGEFQRPPHRRPSPHAADLRGGFCG